MSLHVWVAGIYATDYISYNMVWVCLYNHSTTNLALHDAESSQDKLSITLHLQSIIVTQMYTKLHENVFTSPS